MESKLVQLKAGPLDLIYHKGNLRYIGLTGEELVRMIYAAVRDHNWNTFEPTILNEKLDIQDNSFHISCQSHYGKDEILFKANYEIIGKGDGSITFMMEGEAQADFYKNRIGFCVLHPIKECVGKSCEITDPMGAVYSKKFPLQIAPHQPFKNISRMRWPIGDNNFAQLIFKGDIFETEDQRNWTDASFKTYGTPLSLPFPVLIKKGEQVNQQIEFSLDQLPENLEKKTNDSEIVIIELDKNEFRMPNIGIARNDEKSLLSNSELSLLSQIPFSHYRVELCLDKPNWFDKYILAMNEANQLNWKLELIIFFTSNYKFEIQSFINQVSGFSNKIFSITILSSIDKVTPNILISKVLNELKERFALVKIGAGTNNYFAELNRDRISNTEIDFVSYSMNPQVHAFDNLSIIESLEAQQYTIESAKLFSGDAAVHVSPITLKPRLNPNATGKDPELRPGELPMQVDLRQSSLFGVGFTLGSIAALSKAGASAATFYETVDWRGIIQGDSKSFINTPFKSREQLIYPVYYLFKALLSIDNATVTHCSSNQPLVASAMIVNNNKTHQLFMANYSSSTIKIELKNIPTFKRILIFDEVAWQKCQFDVQNFEKLWTDFHDQIIIAPAYSIIIAELK